jgi:hypothetical protein
MKSLIRLAANTAGRIFIDRRAQSGGSPQIARQTLIERITSFDSRLTAHRLPTAAAARFIRLDQSG